MFIGGLWEGCSLICPHVFSPQVVLDRVMFVLYELLFDLAHPSVSPYYMGYVWLVDVVGWFRLFVQEGSGLHHDDS